MVGVVSHVKRNLDRIIKKEKVTKLKRRLVEIKTQNYKWSIRYR